MSEVGVASHQPDHPDWRISGWPCSHPCPCAHIHHSNVTSAQQLSPRPYEMGLFWEHQSGYKISWNLMSLRMLSLMPSLAAAASAAIDLDHFSLVSMGQFNPQLLLFILLPFAGRAAWMWSGSLQYGPNASQLHGCSAQKNDGSTWPWTTAERGSWPWSPEPHDPTIWNELSTPG